MDQNRLFLIVGTLLSLGLMLLGGFIRFRKRTEKKEADIRKAKRTSWLLYFGGLLFFFMTVLLYTYLVNGVKLF